MSQERQRDQLLAEVVTEVTYNADTTSAILAALTTAGYVVVRLPEDIDFEIVHGARLVARIVGGTRQFTYRTLYSIEPDEIKPATP